MGDQPGGVKPFPRLSIEPDTYDAVWRLDDRRLPGNVTLREGAPPTGAIFDVDGSDLEAGVLYPRSEDRDVVWATLRRGAEVALGDVTLQTWFPERRAVRARWAIVGIEIDRVPDLAFNRARLQITGLDSFFGVAPIKSRTWPASPAAADEATFSATLNPEANLRWEWDGVRIAASYDSQFPMDDAYRQQIRFAPVLTIEVTDPLPVDAWIDQWLQPLLRFVSFATREPQQLSWVRLIWQLGNEPPPEGDRIEAQLFGSGLAQLGYEADEPAWIRERGRRPLLTLATLQRALPQLVGRWRELDVPESVFFSLFRTVMFQPDLPAAARFLFLVQALEALHGSEHEQDDTDRQVRFEQQRASVLDEVRQSSLPAESVKFLKQSWSRRRPDSLARRLRDLIEWLPQNVADDIASLAESEVGQQLAAGTGSPTDVAEFIQRLRNELSHGNSSWPEKLVDPWADGLESIARLHALRLLGFEKDEVAAASSLSRDQ